MANVILSQDKKRRHPVLIIAMLFVISPLGLYWMYKEENWPDSLKYGITIVYVICVTIILLGNI